MLKGKKVLTVIFSLVVAACFLMVNPACAEDYKIAFVDVAKVFDSYEKTKERDAALAAEGEAKQRERDEKVTEIRRLKDELELLSDSGKDEKQALIDEKIKELQDFDMEARRELATKREDIVKDIFEDIDVVVREFGEKNKYDFIFNERVMLFHEDKYDITDNILRELNKRYKS